MPRDIQLIGPAYADESLTFSAQDTVNWIPVPDESGMARSPLQLRGLPGLVALGESTSDLIILASPQSQDEGTAYSYTFTATGGTGPYTWLAVGGIVPPGLALDGSTGVLSGTLTKAGAYSFTIRVTDSLGAYAEGTFGVTVYAEGSEEGVPPSPPVSPPPTTADQLNNVTFTPSNGGWEDVGDSADSGGGADGWSLTNNGGRINPDQTAGRLFCRLNQSGTYIYQNTKTVNTVAGETVTASVWTRCTEQNAGIYYVGARLQTFIDADCTQLARTSYSPFVVFGGVNLTWQQLTVSLTVSNYVKFSLIVYGAPQGNVNGNTQIYFDDATWDAENID